MRVFIHLLCILFIHDYLAQIFRYAADSPYEAKFPCFPAAGLLS
nr:MAG TPA_asm: hypothetical protein [Caudoviricetes sp.]